MAARSPPASPKVEYDLSTLSLREWDVASLEAALRAIAPGLDRTPALSTGSPDLDARINGGLGRGVLIIVAGRPRMGKTALALQFTEHAADRGTPTLVCSQWMSSTQLVDRALAALGRNPLERINQRGLADEEHDRMVAAIDRMQAMPL